MNNNIIIEYRQSKLNRSLLKNIVISCIIVFTLFIFSINLGTSENNKIEDETHTIVHESVTDNQETIVSSANVPDNNNEEKQSSYGMWDSEESYLLGKIAMAEAEGESLKTKVLVILTVLNRVNSDKFPNTIEEVIFEKNSKGVYQFSCISDGRWDRVEPNLECLKAVDAVSKLEYDISEGALFFEACKGETWHSRNLELICVSDNTKFYK